ncbi:NYN domain-containing protein [Ornatilinea apprima]|uniref:NYN domain-containing protein n=1 Tax=Ornatilinea apprima TaxID=1134406 RepID=UPI00094648CF|nr:NYN domain-containing protein [Ornatilinea apprima]
MAYLVDGHNLIPKVRGLSLKSLDDENALMDLLQDFCRARRKRVEVYFDGAPAGRSGTQRMGLVSAHFVRVSSSADDAIANRLRRLGGEARNWSVVSSDRRVQSEARAAGASVISAEAFAADLQAALMESGEERADGKTMSENELNAWLDLFSKGKKKNW